MFIYFCIVFGGGGGGVPAPDEHTKQGLGLSSLADVGTQDESVVVASLVGEFLFPALCPLCSAEVGGRFPERSKITPMLQSELLDGQRPVLLFRAAMRSPVTLLTSAKRAGLSDAFEQPSPL